MDQRDVVATLCKLAAMDRDAVQVYQDAVDKIGDQQVRQQLQQFQQDHSRHVDDIEALLRQRNWQAVEATGEFESMMAGFRKQVELAEPDDGVMVAMDLGERATNAEYAEALQMDLDGESRRVVMRNFEDERQHLRFIESRVPAMAIAGGGGGGSAEVGRYERGNLETATTGEGGMPNTSATGGAGAYGGMGGDVGPGGGGNVMAGSGTRGTVEGDVTADYGMGSRHQGQRLVPGGGGEQGGQGEPGGGGMRGPGTPVGGEAWEPGPRQRGETQTGRGDRAMGGADASDPSEPAGGLNAGVRKGVTSRGSEMVGGGTGADERHPNMGGQVEGDSGSSGSSGAGSGGSD